MGKKTKHDPVPAEWLVIKDIAWTVIKMLLTFFIACPFITLLWRAVFGE